MAKDLNADSLHDPGSHDVAEALEIYAGLDLSNGSALCQALMESVGQEQAEAGRIDLTDQLGPYQPSFTPQMQAWFQSEIEPARAAALDEVRSGFEKGALSRVAAGRGKLIPAERARNDRDKLVNYNMIHTSFRREQQQKLDERDSRRAEFEQGRAMRGNRDPVLTNAWYFLGLLAVVGLEIGVNVESLMQLPWITSPFFAVCAAILIGLAVGFAAHLHGTVLKQWHYWFQSHDPTRVWKASRKLGIGGTLLGVSLAMIGWARYFYVLPQVEIAAIQGLPPPSIMLSVLFMTLTNVIVYGVGVTLAYFCHDEDPDYPPMKIELDKAEKILAGFKGQVDRKLKECDDRWYAEDRKLQVFETSQSASPSWAENSKAFARFCAVEKKVEAALQRYKSALVARLKSEGTPPVFIQPTVTRDDAARDERLSGEQYLGRPISLKLL